MSPYKNTQLMSYYIVYICDYPLSIDVNMRCCARYWLNYWKSIDWKAKPFIMVHITVFYHFTLSWHLTQEVPDIKKCQSCHWLTGTHWSTLFHSYHLSKILQLIEELQFIVSPVVTEGRVLLQVDSQGLPQVWWR